VRGTAFEVSWGQGNAPAHMIQSCVWLDRTHPDWDKWVATALTAAERLGQAFKGGADFVRAVDMDRRGDENARKALEAVAESDDVNERKAAAMLLLARRALKAGNANRAEQLVAQMPEMGAQHVRTIAERLLAE
jgi:thioredoxin-like negative regulator of GroEL